MGFAFCFNVGGWEGVALLPKEVGDGDFLERAFSIYLIAICGVLAPFCQTASGRFLAVLNLGLAVHKPYIGTMKGVLFGHIQL